jgi:hypothetical protein
VGANDAGIEIVWSFLKDKWSELDAKFGDQVHTFPPRIANRNQNRVTYNATSAVVLLHHQQFLMLGRIVETATAYFATEQRVNDLTGNSPHAHLADGWVIVG